MDPDAFRSKMSNLAFGNVMAAAARDYQKELLAQEKSQASASKHEDVDLDALLDDPELERLHAERISALKKETEKRQALERKGHGEYGEVSEADFLAEVTGSQRVVCHFYHREFVRCKIVDKHLKTLAPKYIDTKFIKVDAENAPFFVSKLAIKTLPCVIMFRDGVAFDRIVGFQDLGGIDDFSTSTFEKWLLRKGIILKSSIIENENADSEEQPRRLRSSTCADSDSE